MAIFLRIQQYDAKTGSDTSAYECLNTEMEDDKILVEKAFLPLLINEDALENKVRSGYQKAFNRFFEEGKFLTRAQYNAVQTALVSLDLPRVKLPLSAIEDVDGLICVMYDQPTIDKQRSPSKAGNDDAFDHTAAYRTKLLEKAASQLMSGQIKLPEFVR